MPETTCTLTFTKDEINIIGAGLAELPLKVSGAVFSKVQQAWTRAEVARATPPPVPDPAPEPIAAETL